MTPDAAACSTDEDTAESADRWPAAGWTEVLAKCA